MLEGLAPQAAAYETMDAFRRYLREHSSENIEVFTDFLDLGRFRGPEAEARLSQYLKAKFADARPDLIVSISRAATFFLAQHRNEIAPGVPTAYCCTAIAPIDTVVIPPDMPGIRIDYEWVSTFKLAQSLQPDAKNVVFVSGNSEIGRAWLNDAMRQLKPLLLEREYSVQYLTGGHDEVLQQVARLPRDSIVLLMSILGGNFGAPSEAANDFAQASSAPAYSPMTVLFGGGIVGGNMVSYAEQGRMTADLALELLSGENPEDLPHEARVAPQLRVDARQLQRWGMSERALPPEANVEFRQPTLWEQYRATVVFVFAAILLQAAIIALLLIQMRKRRSAEKLLKESEDRMAFAAASSNIGFWRLDIASGTMWATDHCRAMFGIAPDVPLSWELFRDAIQSDDRLILEEVPHSPRLAEFTRTREFRIALPQIGQRWYMGRYRAEQNGNQTSPQIVGLFVDVTARRTAELQADSQRDELTHMMRVAALGELSGGIAHELSQPLAAILANAQAAQALLAKKTRDEGLLSEILADIVQEDFRAGQVIHRLRRLLKKGEQQTVVVNLNDLISSTLGLLHAELVDRKIKVETKLAGALPMFLGDPVQLQQVFLNLIMNAMEAMTDTPLAQRSITISTAATNEGPVEVRITDRGTGIPAGELGHLFEPYFTTKGHGLGLGLSICSTIIQSHRGQLTLTNAPEGGATAIVRLPMPLQLAAAS